ncbi:MAG: hypothetical protein R6W78_15070 [Bacteroidales bacterium]
MKNAFLILIGLMIINQSFGQESEYQKQNVLRLNFINPGIEYEYSISDKSKLSLNVGFGVSMSYPDLTTIQPNHAFFMSTFFDIHYKNIYNFDRRKSNNKNVEFNAGDFIGIKINGRGKSVNSELSRTDNIDFSFGPTWGIQRNFRRVNMLFNLGPVYYFDTKGNGGFYPIMVELNIGYNILTNK